MEIITLFRQTKGRLASTGTRNAAQWQCCLLRPYLLDDAHTDVAEVALHHGPAHTVVDVAVPEVEAVDVGDAVRPKHDAAARHTTMVVSTHKHKQAPHAVVATGFIAASADRWPCTACRSASVLCNHSPADMATALTRLWRVPLSGESIHCNKPPPKIKQLWSCCLHSPSGLLPVCPQQAATWHHPEAVEQVTEAVKQPPPGLCTAWHSAAQHNMLLLVGANVITSSALGCCRNVCTKCCELFT